MNEELFERTGASRLTRRTIVKTGTKLAYAAPIVAASMKLGTRSAGAVSPLGVRDFCGHSTESYVGDDAIVEGGCKAACKATCGGADDFSLLDAQDPCEQVCATLCPTGSGNNNQCSTDAACDSANFTCDACSATFTDPVTGNTVTGTKTTGTCA